MKSCFFFFFRWMGRKEEFCYSLGLEWQLTNWIFLEVDIITESYHSHVFVSLQKCPRNNMIKAIKRLSYLMIFKVVDNTALRASEASSWNAGKGRGFFFFFFSSDSVSSFLAGWRGIVMGQRKKNWMERGKCSVLLRGREGNDSQTKARRQMFE